jgi:hypothetical protein
MKVFYEIHVNFKKIGKSVSREDAYGYIKQEYSGLLPFLEYDAYGVGDIEIWKNGIIQLEIHRKINNKYKVDVIELLENNKENKKSTKKEIKEKEEKEEIKEINVARVMPCTPRRTRIKNNKDVLEKAEENKIIEKDGKKYIAKNGKWSIYRENNYSKKNSSTSKRKAPKSPAKNYKEGIVKKGEDGNNWIVKKQKNGNNKWFKK